MHAGAASGRAASQLLLGALHAVWRRCALSAHITFHAFLRLCLPCLLRLQEEEYVSDAKEKTKAM